MENKYVGIILIGISLVVGFILFLLHDLSRNNLELSCSHGPSCGMYQSLNLHYKIAYSLVFFIFFVGIILIFIKPKEKLIIKEKTKFIKEKKNLPNLKNLDLDEKEKKLLEILKKENGVVFQAELKEILGIGKVGMTRLLDKLEAKQLIERKRRGMNNIVVLKR